MEFEYVMAYGDCIAFQGNCFQSFSLTIKCYAESCKVICPGYTASCCQDVFDLTFELHA